MSENSKPPSKIRLAAVSAAPLDLEAHLAAIEDPHCGAVTTFIGRVRDHDPAATGTVVSLEYSAHPDAGHFLRRMLEAAVPAGAAVAASHRVGPLRVGDIAVIVCVASPHRAEAFDACRLVVESIKHDLPVWKRQHDDHGISVWVGL